MNRGTKYALQTFTEKLLGLQGANIEENEKSIVICAEMGRSWYKGIVNSFFISVTNGTIEGCNNKIKVLEEMHTDTVILNDSETVFYRYFLINDHIKNKQPHNATACF